MLSLKFADIAHCLVKLSHVLHTLFHISLWMGTTVSTPSPGAPTPVDPPSEVSLRALDPTASLMSELSPPNARLNRTLRCKMSDERNQTVIKLFLGGLSPGDLLAYKEKLKAQKMGAVGPNLLPFQRFGPQAFASRQYFFANLRDRLNMRPFLEETEKLWIAYQLLCAGAQLHECGFGHGDVKSENVMLTSWGWLVLTDFAPYKPVFLPPDQSAAPFNFFFSSGRRRCYLAPERFTPTAQQQQQQQIPTRAQQQSAKRKLSAILASNDPKATRRAVMILADAAGVPRSTREENEAQIARTSNDGGAAADSDSFTPPWRKDINGELLPSMDVFSIGCVLAELFNADGETTLELVDALQYAATGTSPRLEAVLGKILRPDIRALVKSMTNRDPCVRLRLGDYIELWTDGNQCNTFPKPFRDFLYPFMKSFLTELDVEDALVWRSCEKYSEIVRNLCYREDGSVVKDVEGDELFAGIFRAYENRVKLDCGQVDFSEEELRVASASSKFSMEDPLESALIGDSNDLLLKIQSALSSSKRLVKSITSSTSLGEATSTNAASSKLRFNTAAAVDEEMPQDEFQDVVNDGMIIIVNYLCVASQNAAKPYARVVALLLLQRLSQVSHDDEAALQRVLPYVVDRLNDASTWVRCIALKVLPRLLDSIKQVPASESKLFSDYLLPRMIDCSRDSSEAVRVAFAESFPSIAASAKRFLDLTYAATRVAAASSYAAASPLLDVKSKSAEGGLPSYDEQLEKLYTTMSEIMRKIVATDAVQHGQMDAAVKGALVSQVFELCMVFGRERTNEFLLPWLITVINTPGPGYWRLQVEVLKSLAAVGAFVGADASGEFLFPLIVEMLQSSDLVIEAAANSLSNFVALGLLGKRRMCELANRVAPWIRHPSRRVRLSLIRLVASCAASPYLTHIDVQAYISEALRAQCKSSAGVETSRHHSNYLVLLGRAGTSRVDNEIILEDCLEQCKDWNDWCAYLLTLSGPGSANAAAAAKRSPTPLNVAQVKKPSQPQPPPANKLSNATGGSNDAVTAAGIAGGDGFDSKGVVRVHTLTTTDIGVGGISQWQTSPSSSGPVVTTSPLSSIKNQTQLPLPLTIHQIAARFGIVLHPPEDETIVSDKILTRRAIALSIPEMRLNVGRYLATSPHGSTSFVHTGRSNNVGDWRPRGILIASLNEHSGPVNRIAVSEDSSFFATCSDDGSARVWSTDRLDRVACPRSKGSFGMDGSRAVDVCCIKRSNSFAVAFDSGTVSLVRVERTSEAESQLALSRNVNSRVVAIANPTSTDLYICTEKGSVFHWDTRSGDALCEMALPLGFGSVSCMAVSSDCMWLCVGTHRGVVAVFDLRYQIAVCAWRHPRSCAVHRLYCSRATECHPLVFVAAGPNQAVLLNLETGDTRYGFAVAKAELAQTDQIKQNEWRSSQTSFFAEKYERIDLMLTRHIDRYVNEAKFSSSIPHDSIRAIVCPCDVSGDAVGVGTPPTVLTAGTDAVVRLWDCRTIVSGSSIVSAPSDEPRVKWEMREVDTSLAAMNNMNSMSTSMISARKTHVYLCLPMLRPPSAADGKGGGASKTAVGKFTVRPSHSDAILDLASVRIPDGSSGSSFSQNGMQVMLTAGRDAVIKVWR